MKVIAVFLALAAAAIAGNVDGAPCDQPGTYSCSRDQKTAVQGWVVCDVTNTWRWGGECDNETVCKFNEASHSPYCVPLDFEFSRA
ncbi:hypothetical protein GQ53DRAFT_674911 [Thozetella sp. PMI_491]|nr:hypothetical protein GQ53DRAFT_674911 [Thozetella sp. PMI_491]